jgi:hypothetical protein
VPHSLHRARRVQYRSAGPGEKSDWTIRVPLLTGTEKKYAEIWTVFFVGYFTTSSVAGLRSSNGRQIMNWKGLERKQSLPNPRNILAFSLDEQNKTTENSGQPVHWPRLEPKPLEYEFQNDTAMLTRSVVTILKWIFRV